MSNPRTLKIPLEEYGYYMELDTSKQDCSREPAHWHLCKNGVRIGQITPYCTWTSYPPTDVKSSIIKEAEITTSTYADKIRDFYDYNRFNGSD